MIIIFFLCNVIKEQIQIILQKNSINIRIRYGETDQMGIVYHGNYAHFFEVGRTEWLRSLGTSYKQLEKSGIMLPVVSLQANFKKSAFYDEIITVNTYLKKTPSVKIDFDYEITNKNKDILCTGNTVLVFVNATTMKPTRCPEFILEKLTELKF